MAEQYCKIKTTDTCLLETDNLVLIAQTEKKFGKRFLIMDIK